MASSPLIITHRHFSFVASIELTTLRACNVFLKPVIIILIVCFSLLFLLCRACTFELLSIIGQKIRLKTALAERRALGFAITIGDLPARNYGEDTANYSPSVTMYSPTISRNCPDASGVGQ